MKQKQSQNRYLAIASRVSCTTSCTYTAELQLQSVEDGKHYFSTMHLSKFRSLYNDAAFSDVVVRAAGPGVKAHKAILAVSSPTFKTMFEVILCSVILVGLCVQCVLVFWASLALTEPSITALVAFG